MMPSSHLVNNKEEASKVSEEFNTLVRRQNELEREIASLKDMLKNITFKNDVETEKINQRIDDLEEEVNEIREVLNELKTSVKLIQTGINSVEKHVSDINSKQDVAITAQDKFIGQLWKAFFALLGVVTAGGAALVALLK